MSAPMMAVGLFRVCVKVYAPEPVGIGSDAEAFVPVFHDWIRAGDPDLVLFDVADYAHVPDGPGIMLVAHEIAFALDRSDGRFGLLGQRRTPIGTDAVDAIEHTLRHTLQVAERLEADARLAGRLRFDRTEVRIESNDRLRAPNTDRGFDLLSQAAGAALDRLGCPQTGGIRRVANDPRDRLALTVPLPSTIVTPGA